MNREEIIKLAQEIWGASNWSDAQAGRLERFAALVAAKEREACAKVVEIFDRTFQTGGGIASSIRARGMK